MICRVFPRRTNSSPDDQHAYFTEPDLFTPRYKEAHVSCVFTWDIPRAKALAKSWESHAEKVIIGGPAFNSYAKDFMPGMYLKKGITITTRGCPNNCNYCFVPIREGKLRELPIKEGHIVQDNNILRSSEKHIDSVFKMLRKQKKPISFTGGIDVYALNDNFIEKLRTIKLSSLFLAYDKPAQRNAVQKAVEKLRKYFKWRQLMVYCLIGYKGDTIEAARERLDFIIDIGATPFAQKERIPVEDFKQSFTQYSREWNQLNREYSNRYILATKHKAKGRP